MPLCRCETGRNAIDSETRHDEKAPDPKIEGFRVLYVLTVKNCVCHYPFKHQSTPKISGVLCDHVFIFAVPVVETSVDHLTAVVHVLSTFKLMRFPFAGLADQRLT